MNKLKIKVLKIEKLLQNAEKITEKFKDKFKLDCLQGCGKCCLYNNIDASSLEFLPLAESVWENSGAVELLEKLQNIGDDEHCVFYIHDENNPNKGFCSVYKKRGLICRLYGFSLRRNKQKKLEILTCKGIKDKYNPKIVDSNNNKFLMSAYYLRLANIDYTRAFERLPINQAIREAIIYYGLMSSFNKPKGENRNPGAKGS